MSRTTERRVKALEERTEQRKGKNRLLWQDQDGTITEYGKGPVSPGDIGPADQAYISLRSDSASQNGDLQFMCIDGLFIHFSLYLTQSHKAVQKSISAIRFGKITCRLLQSNYF